MSKLASVMHQSI